MRFLSSALFWRILLSSLVVVAVLGSVWGLGRWTRGLLFARSSFQISLTDIDCQPPRGLSRAEFLGEVGA